MTPFETAFPGFVEACAALHSDLMPFAILLLMIGTLFDQAQSNGAPAELIKAYIRAFLILLLLFNSSSLLNEGQELVKRWVERNIPARPENVAERYKQRLREAQQLGDRADESFIRQVLSGDWYEAIILAFLTLISWLAMAVLAFVYSIQRALLIGCWAISPLLFPCLAIRPLYWIGMQHVLRLLGIMLWPIGLALAATFTSGVIDTVVGDTSFADAAFGEAIGKGLTGLLGVGIIAIWIMVSTIAAPVYVQRLVTGVSGPATAVSRGGELLGTSLVAGAAAASRRTWVAASALTTTASTTTTAPSAADTLPLLNTAQVAPAGPSPSDPTGDHAAAAILQSQKEPTA